MITIERIEFKNEHRYLWLKYVTGINLAVHCANCLRGTYDKRVNKDLREISNLELGKAPFYYLCGVEKRFIWEKNLHIAFREKQDSVIEINDAFCKARIINAERIDVVPDYIDYSLPHAKTKSYNTCRNWQFANWLAVKGYFKDNKAKYRQLTLF